MLRSHKISIARIFADLIKADRIIDTGEMECWQRLCDKYSIDREIETESQLVSFAEAVNCITGSGFRGLREDLLGDCRSMTVSDGFCAHSEALLMVTLTIMLDVEQKIKAEVFSIPKADFNIDIATALYVENDYDRAVNEAIEQGYRTIFKEFQLSGFHFVYLPKIIDHYRNTDPKLFHNILSFLAPSISEEGLAGIYRSLMKMTTETFCKDLLCNKLGIADLRGTSPSILIKIGNSFVGEDPYANYLKLEVDEDIIDTVQSFVDQVGKMLRGDVFIVNTSEERGNQFHFHGFYKQLLDIFLIRRNIRSTILIDPYREEILFPDIDVKATGLHRRERALYALLLCQGDEGLNFNLPRNQEMLARYNRRMNKIQKRYSMIYGIFGGEPQSAPDLASPEIRRPIVACLRRSLRELPALYNPQDYTVTKNKEGIFSVNVDPSLIYVREIDSDIPRPLHESSLYRRWKECE